MKQATGVIRNFREFHVMYISQWLKHEGSKLLSVTFWNANFCLDMGKTQGGLTEPLQTASH
jgi:hypothetical protein